MSANAGSARTFADIWNIETSREEKILMLIWLSANTGNIIVILILALVIFFAVRTIVRDKQQGKSSCGCQCGDCSMSGSCHNRRNQQP